MEKTGIKQFDERYGGIKGGSLLVIASGTGKTLVGNPECLHTQCTECHGTGRKENGETCVHFISCPCPRCTPRY